MPGRAGPSRCCGTARCWSAMPGAGPMPSGASPSRRTTLFRMCSITKQFTCALVLDALPRPRRCSTPTCAPPAEARGRRPRARCICPQPVGPARLLGGGDAARRAGRGAFGEAEAARADRRRPAAAVRAGHALFLRQPELPPPVGHRGSPDRPRLSPSCCAGASSSRPAWRPPSRRRHAGHAGRDGGLRGQPGRRLPCRRKPHPVDAATRASAPASTT